MTEEQSRRKIEPIKFTGKVTQNSAAIFDALLGSAENNTVNIEIESAELRSQLEKGALAYELWREWFEKEGDPTYASESGGDIHCFFCGAWVEHDDHEPDCLYVRAKQLIED